MINLIYPINGQAVPMLTDEQKYFLSVYDIRAGFKDTESPPRWPEESEFSVPRPVTFNWEVICDDHDDDETVLFRLLLSTNEDLSSPIVRIVSGNTVDVYNLMAGKKYYWCLEYDNNAHRTPIESFCTEDVLPRVIHVDGVTNIRDLGGYKVPDGVIRQGLLYRGAKLDTFEQDRPGQGNISPEGVDEILDLGIRTEVDLRRQAIERGIQYGVLEPFGVDYKIFPLEHYHHLFEDEWREAASEFFRLLSRPEAYPIYLHCYAGADRTGTVAYIIGALLGMSEEDLITDYEFSTLSMYGLRTRNYEEWIRFVQKVDEFPGQTLAQRAHSCLKEHFGLTDEEIASIKNILIEK